MEPEGEGGGSSDEFPPVCCSTWCGGLPRVMGATGGLGYVSQVATVGGLSLPGACGPASNVSHQIIGVSCRVVSLMRHERILSFHHVECDT